MMTINHVTVTRIRRQDTITREEHFEQIIEFVVEINKEDTSTIMMLN